MSTKKNKPTAKRPKATGRRFEVSGDRRAFLVGAAIAYEGIANLLSGGVTAEDLKETALVIAGSLREEADSL